MALGDKTEAQKRHDNEWAWNLYHQGKGPRPESMNPNAPWERMATKQDQWAAGRPTYPGFKPMLNEDQTLQDQFRIDPMEAIQFTGDLDALHSRAFTEGPSAWANLALERVGLQEKAGMDRVAKLADSSVADAWSKLTMGGASAGAQERLASEAMRNAIFGKQAVARDADMAEIDVLESDEGRKRDWAQLYATEAGRKQGLDLENRDYDFKVQNQNMDRAFQAKRMQEEAALKKYTEDMAAWAAERQAQATENAGSGGMCFITTAVCETLDLPDDCDELETLREFRDRYMKPNHPGDVERYYRVAPEIVSRIQDKRTYPELLVKYIRPAVDMIKQGNDYGAYFLYRTMVNNLCAKYGVK